MSDSSAGPPKTPSEWEVLANHLFIAERERQVVEEGYTSAHDEREGALNLLNAASYYLGVKGNASWPWNRQYYKPKGAVRNLVRAGALVMAAQSLPMDKSVADLADALLVDIRIRLILTFQEAHEVFAVFGWVS